MEVILREHVDNLGRRGDIVKVADGLRPELSAAAQARSGGQRGQQAPDRARAEKCRSARARREDRRPRRSPRGSRSVEIAIARRVGENDTLYGSVTTADIAHALAAKGFEVDRRKIVLADPLKALGEYTVPVKIHRDVTAQVKVRWSPRASKQNIFRTKLVASVFRRKAKC